MNQTNLPQSLLTALLVVLESALGLILRFDSKLRQAAYPLAQNNTVVCIRSYVPHEEVYISFTFKGLLIDTQLPADKQKPDVIINAYSFQIFTSIFSNKEATVEKLQFRGEAQQVDLVKSFMKQLSISNIFGLVKNKENKTKQEDTKDTSQKTHADNAQKIQTLYQKLDVANIENKKLSTQVNELKSKQKLFISIAVIATIIAIISFFI